MALANDGAGGGGVNSGWSPAVDILLKAVGDTPIMKTKKWAVERTRTIQGLVDFIKKFLKLMASEQLVGAAARPGVPCAWRGRPGPALAGALCTLGPTVSLAGTLCESRPRLLVGKLV